MAKKAFLVGINRYKDPGNNLKGCVNDVLAMSGALREHYGFAGRAVRLLTDERATSAGIRKGLAWLVKGAAAGDSLVFHYSGHGAQVRDESGDELSDGLDEIICPHDLDWDRPFADDELGAVARAVPKGALLTVILDSCHSGTGLRDPRRADLPVRRKAIVPPVDVPHRAEPRIEDRGVNASATMAGPDKTLAARRFGVCVTRTGGVLVAACRDGQTSADAWIDGDYRGAHTYYLLRALSDLGWKATFREAVAAAGAALARHNFDQVPQLEGPAKLISAPVFGG